MWLDNARVILRSIINDNSSELEFSDDRLDQILLSAAYQVCAEVDFSTSYVVDISCETVTPDPSSDKNFINLTTIKAACIIDRGKLRTAAALSGLRSKCGPVEFQTLQHMDGFTILLQHGWCAVYEQARLQYGFGNATFCQAILSPFTNENFNYYG